MKTLVEMFVYSCRAVVPGLKKNSVERPVKICKNGDSQSAREFNILHFSRSISLFKGKSDGKVTVSVLINSPLNLMVLIFFTKFQ